MCYSTSRVWSASHEGFNAHPSYNPVTRIQDVLPWLDTGLHCWQVKSGGVPEALLWGDFKGNVTVK